MKILELFSGNADITKTFEKIGIECVSVDYDKYKNPKVCMDVYKLPIQFLKQFDAIWLSPDCTTYSFASHGLHRKSGGIPVSKQAFKTDILNEKLFKTLEELDIPFICENPRAHFRHMPWTKNLYRITIYYSTYGAKYTKPTDLFSNRKEMLEIFNTTATRGKIHLDYITNYNNFLERCKIPDLLLNDICKALMYEN